MSKPYNCVGGIYVPCLDKIEEGYSVVKKNDYYQFTINVSAENIDVVFRTLCKKVNIPGFLVLEHGTNSEIEEDLRECSTDPFPVLGHKRTMFSKRCILLLVKLL